MSLIAWAWSTAGRGKHMVADVIQQVKRLQSPSNASLESFLPRRRRSWRTEGAVSANSSRRGQE